MSSQNPTLTFSLWIFQGDPITVKLRISENFDQPRICGFYRIQSWNGVLGLKMKTTQLSNLRAWRWVHWQYTSIDVGIFAVIATCLTCDCTYPLPGAVAAS